MRRPGRTALLTALLLLLVQLCPGNCGWGTLEAVPPRDKGLDRSLRWSLRNQAGGASALLLLLTERFPRLAAGTGTLTAPLGGRPKPKRDEPSLSIDLTFHLLRTLLELARTQSQRERAEQNRLIFDSVGK
ncbi:urocortin [Monodelphis domestica]|uniref:Urocortin n=1 Tax=Monodelphis domestica TaxID=13616 RepID=F7AVH6_MONDO|nr:urocortin [Monodelphis domestica]